MNILVTGATGLIGKKLIVDLQELGHKVIGLSRDKKSITENPQSQAYSWDALSSADFPAAALKNMDVVFHLAGTPVADRRWNEKIKSDILKSRVNGTQKIIQAISKMQSSDRPKIFMAASAIGFYGDHDQTEIDESTAAGSDFLSDVVVQWENESIKAIDLGLRTVILRTGIVLSREGGALAKMPPVVIGDGKNQMSWIHIQDWVSFVLEALENKKYTGIYNLVSPSPVPQNIFVKALAKAKGIPITLWSPKFIVQTALGELSKVILTSQKVLPKAALDQGFKFKFKTIQSALVDLYKK